MSSELMVKLRERLSFGPPSLRELLSRFASLEDVTAFYALVDEYLPDSRRRLEQMPLTDAVDTFGNLFSRRYFPIGDSIGMDLMFGEECPDGLSTLVNYVPVHFDGFNQEDYESDGVKPALLLAMAVCESPYDDGDRIPAVEELAKLVGEKAVKVVPEKGWGLGDLEIVLAKSPYPGLLVYCHWIHGTTGNSFLDTNLDDFSWEVTWERDTIDTLTRDWKEYQKLDPDDIVKLWKELDGKKEYPLDDLVEHGTVADLMQQRMEGW